MLIKAEQDIISKSFLAEVWRWWRVSLSHHLLVNSFASHSGIFQWQVAIFFPPKIPPKTVVPKLVVVTTPRVNGTSASSVKGSGNNGDVRSAAMALWVLCRGQENRDVFHLRRIAMDLKRMWGTNWKWVAIWAREPALRGVGSPYLLEGHSNSQ